MFFQAHQFNTCSRLHLICYKAILTARKLINCANCTPISLVSATDCWYIRRGNSIVVEWSKTITLSSANLKKSSFIFWKYSKLFDKITKTEQKVVSNWLITLELNKAVLWTIFSMLFIRTICLFIWWTSC